MKRIVLLSLILAAATAVAFSIACGGGGGAQKVSVTLHDDEILLSTDVVKPGKVTFEVKNEGTKPHEFMVIKSDLPPDQLPIKDNKVDEDNVNVFNEIGAFGKENSPQKLTLTLNAGKYVLLCNILELPPGEPPNSHYRNGMNTGLVAEAEAK